MLNKLQHAFDFEEAALRLRAKRQEVIASNIANDTTPGYKARDIDFAQSLSSQLTKHSSGAAPDPSMTNTTHSQHMDSGIDGASGGLDLMYRTPHQSSIDGNTVEVEDEKSRFTDNAMHYMSVSNSLQQDFMWWSKFLQDTR